MVRVSIYNEKGGVGKTTVTALLASYLAYVHGESVCVADFDYPSYHFMELRRSELAILEDPKSPLAGWLRANPRDVPPYDVLTVPAGPSGVYYPTTVFPFLENVMAGGYSYVLLDFPGRFTFDEPVSYVAANGYLDYVAVPMDTDSQSRRSALVVADAMRRQGVPLVLFWNRVSVSEAKGDGSRFRRGAEPFLSRGLPVMDEVLRDIRKISRDPSEMSFVRSTLCFPVRYVNKWSPAIIPFLEALKGRIDSLKPASR